MTGVGDIRAGLVVDVAADSTAVTTRGTKIWGIYINTALSAHALPIKDAAGNVLATIPASAPAGNSYDLFGVFAPGGVTIDPNDSATGNITVVYELVKATGGN